MLDVAKRRLCCKLDRDVVRTRTFALGAGNRLLSRVSNLECSLVVMSATRSTRSERGLAQSFANQLAQMAVGVEAMCVGSVLKREPYTGVIVIDAMARSASVNDHPTELALAGYLNDWIIGEVRRKGLDPSWLSRAVITIHYSWQPGTLDQAPWADLEAGAVVTSRAGQTTGTYANKQPLVGA